MTAEKTDLQKLEALLHSATNERQRKMYQALLSKAQTSLVSSASTSSEQQTTQSLTKTKKSQASPNRTARGKSSKNKAVSTNNSTAECSQPQAGVHSAPLQGGERLTKKSITSNTSNANLKLFKKIQDRLRKLLAKRKKNLQSAMLIQ